MRIPLPRVPARLRAADTDRRRAVVVAITCALVVGAALLLLE